MPRYKITRLIEVSVHTDAADAVHADSMSQAMFNVVAEDIKKRINMRYTEIHIEELK